MTLNAAIIITITFVLIFITGVLIGGICALMCVKFGIRASYEVRNGNQGLFEEQDNIQAELDMLDKKDEHGNPEQQIRSE